MGAYDSSGGLVPFAHEFRCQECGYFHALKFDPALTAITLRFACESNEAKRKADVRWQRPCSSIGRAKRGDLG